MIRELLNNLNENGLAYLIVCALSAWLGKVWAGRIARIEHQKLESELIQLKDKLEKGQKLFGGEIEKKVHVHKAQFEKEFGVYQELMKHANALRSAYFTLHMSVEPCFLNDDSHGVKSVSYRSADMVQCLHDVSKAIERDAERLLGIKK